MYYLMCVGGGAARLIIVIVLFSIFIFNIIFNNIIY